ncbi:hypothetical protein SAY87_008840 [Trapa incisa]|nr:hypothetical protein SAY87_008840 [Trapa incisa]
MKRTQHRAIKAGLWTVGLCMVGFVVGRPLYWHLTLRSSSFRHRRTLSCPRCECDCSSEPLLSLVDGLSNHSFSMTDCMKHDPEVSEEMEKNFIDMLTEEVKQQEALALENQQRAAMMLLEAKKMASQFQKEADKCSSGMETCEEAREKSEAALELQQSLTTM